MILTMSFTWLLYNLQQADILGTDFENLLYASDPSEQRDNELNVYILIISYLCLCEESAETPSNTPETGNPPAQLSYGQLWSLR